MEELHEHLAQLDVERAKELCLLLLHEYATLAHASGPALLIFSYGIAVILVYWLQSTTRISSSAKKVLIVLPIAFFFVTPVIVRNHFPPILSFLVRTFFFDASLID